MAKIAIRKEIASFVSEYDTKLANLDNALADLAQAHADIYTACSVQGMYGRENLNVTLPWKSTLEKHLKKSAWLHLVEYKNLNKIMSANDKVQFERSLETAPDFTPENIIASLGKYLANPRAQILRGLAEVFSSLDPFYKSHDKVKIGVQGLPKRIIISNVNSIYGYGHDKLRDVMNALAQYQGKPMVEHRELAEFIKGDLALKTERGVWLKTFKNGNAHLFFTPDTLLDINRALAEYYGEVLYDAYEPKPNQRATSTEVSKDLQYYATPKDVVDKLIYEAQIRKDDVILEPSCGTGNIMQAARNAGAIVHGVEVHAGRAQEAREKGFNVWTGNFLEVPPPKRLYNKVLMNPPFYGKHYVKHIKHALKFLKDGGRLYAILPITAKTDHGLLDEYSPRWHELPTGSFSEVGTNINTVICMIFK